MQTRASDGSRSATIWLANLAFPALIAAAVHFSPQPVGPGISGVSLQQFASSYAMLAAPAWLWSAIAAVTGTSSRVMLGGLFAANALLVVVAVLVLRSSVPEAANAWLIYLLGSPVAVVVGAVLARRRHPPQNAA